MDNLHLNEIEQIQAEIERDLKKVCKPKPDSSTENAHEHEADALTSVNTETIADIETIFKVEAETNTLSSTDDAETETPVYAITDSPTENFYRETIKVESPVVYANQTKKRSWPRTVAVICLACTLGAASLGFGIGAASVYVKHHFLGGISQEQMAENAETDRIISTQYAFNDVSDVPREGTLSDMVKLVEPSVVSVSATFDAATRSGMRVSISDGSGIIFSEDKDRVYIATNHHVAGGAVKVQVSIMGSDMITAHPVGSDPDADLQVIYVEKRDLKAAGVHHLVIATFGDSDEMEVGDVVLAIGNAMGDGNSATRGIISAKERNVTIEGRKLTMLQTDAAINQGNSGGPLINTRGEVIGINTAKFSSGGFFGASVEGMGYSISSNIAKPILDELMNRTSRPALGIYGQSVTDDIADEMNIALPMGVYVSGIIKNSGADKAGVKRTDIITGFNGKPVLTMEQLVEEISQCEVGDTVELKVLRDGRNAVILNVTLSEMEVDRF